MSNSKVKNNNYRGSTCYISKVQPKKIVRRSHAMNANIDVRKPNLIRKKVNGKVYKVSARILKTLKKKNISLIQAINAV